MRLSEVLNSIADRGRDLLDLRRGGATSRSMAKLCRDLMSQRGEASGTALAREVVQTYAAMDADGRAEFFEMVCTEFAPAPDAILSAADTYRHSPDLETFLALSQAVEPPRQELFRRMNMAPQGTSALVGMRADLLDLLAERPHLKAVDADLKHLLTSWFNRGFLRLERIDLRTPAVILEKLIAYEAVHEIRGWEDLRRRLAQDRRCFAFFHPALRDEPLIFVEVALVKGMAEAIQPLVDPAAPSRDPKEADSAIFYSISNCQKGLQGISFGNFLIKQVAVELADELPNLKTFATLSPIPGFGPWLRAARASDEGSSPLRPDEREILDLLDAPDWPADPARADALRRPLTRLCAHYLLKERQADGKPRDPVARFHLGNGARLQRIDWLADVSPKGLRQSAGLMVNYDYRLSAVERNHEAYVNNGEVIASSAVKGLLKG